MARSSKYLFGNLMCAVDVETTGLVAGYNDIWQVCVLPLTSDCTPAKDCMPFYMNMKVRYPDHIEPKAIKLSKTKFAISQQSAIDPWSCADLFDEWFQKLKLPFGKKIVPLAQNWPFDRAFIQEWLGIETFDQFFSPHYRDTMAAAIFLTDIADLKQEPQFFMKFNLGTLCARLGVTNQCAHDALQDCLATAEVYHRLLRWAA